MKSQSLYIIFRVYKLRLSTSSFHIYKGCVINFWPDYDTIILKIVKYIIKLPSQADNLSDSPRTFVCLVKIFQKVFDEMFHKYVCISRLTVSTLNEIQFRSCRRIKFLLFFALEMKANEKRKNSNSKTVRDFWFFPLVCGWMQSKHISPVRRYCCCLFFRSFAAVGLILPTMRYEICHIELAIRYSVLNKLWTHKKEQR